MDTQIRDNIISFDLNTELVPTDGKCLILGIGITKKPMDFQAEKFKDLLEINVMDWHLDSDSKHENVSKI
jgi:hypothetical protein